jgi:hypothetical protein
MATKDSFTAEEWTLLRIAPSLVSVGITAADPSGLFGSVKEAVAGSNRMLEALSTNRELELFAALSADRSIPGVPDVQQLLGDGTREQQLENFKAAALQQVSTAAELVARKATVAEAAAYRQMLVNIADTAAGAAKEGGFLGFGGVRVSDRERAFIAAVSRAVGIE